MGRRTTIRDLAREAQVEEDQALVDLWGNGIEYLETPADALRDSDLNRARQVLGIPTRRELLSIEFWQDHLGTNREDFIARAATVGVEIRRNKRTLPKGAIRKLRALSANPLVSLRQLEPPRPAQKHSQPFVFRQVGHRRDTFRYLTAEEINRIHCELAMNFAATDDPISPPGVRTMALLESAAFRPQTSAGESLKYQTVETAAAALCHSIICNHPFHNGNKRTGLVATLVFLYENGFAIQCEEAAVFKFVLKVARRDFAPPDISSRPDREVVEMATWIASQSRRIERGERPMQWRKLRAALAAYGCDCDASGGVGNRLTIIRKVITRSRILRINRERFLKTQVFWPGDGKDAPPDTISKIRRDLELDEDHGIDSSAFYDHGGTIASEIIMRYHQTLRRLARL